MLKATQQLLFLDDFIRSSATTFQLKIPPSIGAAGTGTLPTEQALSLVSLRAYEQKETSE